MPSKVIIIVRVYVLGHKYVLGSPQTHFDPRQAARAKINLTRAQSIFMPANISLFYCFIRKTRARNVLKFV